MRVTELYSRARPQIATARSPCVRAGSPVSVSALAVLRSKRFLASYVCVKLRPGNTDVKPSTHLLLLLILFLNPSTQFPGNEKNTLCNTEKYKNQPGMNLTPPPPSQNSYTVRWHKHSKKSQNNTSATTQTTVSEMAIPAIININNIIIIIIIIN